MSTVFVAYTELSVESMGGDFRKMIISPVNTDTIPEDVKAEFPGNLREQIIHAAIDPENLDGVVGIFRTYSLAETALSRIPYWQKRQA